MPFATPKTQHRCDVDDGTPFAGREHAPRRLLRPEEDRIEIGGDDAPPLRFRQLDRTMGMRDSGIVDENGDAAECRLGCIEGLYHGAMV